MILGVEFGLELVVETKLDSASLESEELLVSLRLHDDNNIAANKDKINSFFEFFIYFYHLKPTKYCLLRLKVYL